VWEGDTRKHGGNSTHATLEARLVLETVNIKARRVRKLVAQLIRLRERRDRLLEYTATVRIAERRCFVVDDPVVRAVKRVVVRVERCPLARLGDDTLATTDGRLDDINLRGRASDEGAISMLGTGVNLA
jgi:hypothetical protein